MRSRLAPGSLLLAPLALLVACGGGGSKNPDGGGDSADATTTFDAPVPEADAAVDATPDADTSIPLFRNPLPDLGDAALALQALQLLGAQVQGADRNCNACHSLSRQRLRSWGALSAESLEGCLTNLAVTDPAEAKAMTDCLHRLPTQPDDTPFVPERLGFYATGVQLEWFPYLFKTAFGESAWEAEYQEFADRVHMPRGEHAPFTQGEFDIIAEWLARGQPLLDTLVPDEPSTGTCTPSITPEVASHVDLMATSGWGAVNAENNINMFGCAGATTPRGCLTSFPRASSIPAGTEWEALPGAVLRILDSIDFQSAYWTRSSADGRFVSFGGAAGNPNNYGSTIVDLADGREIPANAYYDPGFFPDNSGFALQGGGAHFCDQSLLTSAPESISFTEEQCRDNNAVTLYQHLGAALGGGDYWTVAGVFESDNGGHSATLQDPRAPFRSDSRISLTALVFDGTRFVTKGQAGVGVPNEGDSVLAPSAAMLVSRVRGNGDSQGGFRLRKVVTTRDGSTVTASAPEIARYCFNGGKPGFSFDERWMVIHHYVEDRDAVELGFSSASDPGFAAYRSQGAANVYLVDLLTGDRTRLTSMQPGQYALFPHFRSDGWIYFQVRIADQSKEYTVASDAVFVVGAP